LHKAAASAHVDRFQIGNHHRTPFVFQSMTLSISPLLARRLVLRIERLSQFREVLADMIEIDDTHRQREVDPQEILQAATDGGGRTLSQYGGEK
jgi:hypothetical protein